MNEETNVAEELCYIRQEFEKLNKTLLEIKALLTPTDLTISTQEIKESIPNNCMVCKYFIEGVVPYDKPENLPVCAHQMGSKNKNRKIQIDEGYWYRRAFFCPYNRSKP